MGGVWYGVADAEGAFNEQKSSAKIVSFVGVAIQFFRISITVNAPLSGHTVWLPDNGACCNCL